MSIELGMLICGAIAFFPALFYGKNNCLGIFMHIFLPVVIGFCLYWGPNLQEFGKPGSEFTGWSIVFVPLFCLGGFSGSIFGNIVGEIVRDRIK